MSGESQRINAWGYDFTLTAQQNGLLRRMVAWADLLARAMPMILAMPGVSSVSFEQRMALERPIVPTDGEYVELMVTIRLIHDELSYRIDRDLRENEITAGLYDPDSNIRVSLFR